MHTPLQNYMDVGTVLCLSFPDILDDEQAFFDAVYNISRDAFFSAVELCWVPNDNIKDRIRSVLAASDLKIGYAAQSQIFSKKLNLAAVDENVRQRAVQEITRLVDDARRFGAVQFTFFDGPNSFPGDGQEADALAGLEASILEICHYSASKKGLQINLEAFDRSVDTRSLIGPSALGAQLARRVRQQYEEFGLTINLGHLPLLGESIADSLEAVRDVVTHVYLGNCVVFDPVHPLYGDNHPPFGYEHGEFGVDELAESLEVLLDIGFLDNRKRELPIVSLAVKPLPDQDPYVVLASAKRTLNKAWRLI